jgi:hypothetical protein
MRQEPEIVPIIIKGKTVKVYTCDEYKREVAEKLMKLVDSCSPEDRKYIHETADIMGAKWK